MNVLFITTCTTLLGANRAMLTQIQHLKSKGVVPIVLLPFDGEITLKLKEQNVEYCVHKFKTFKSPHSGVPSYIRFMAVLLYNFLYALPLLYVVFRKRNISIIHTNTSVCDIGAFLASMLHCRHIWHLREFGCEDYGLTCPIKKYEYYVYNRGFSEFIAISGAIYTYYSVFIKRPIYLVYDGVTIPDSKFLANHENSEIHFCCAGVLTVQKNQLQIVEAANILLNKYLVNNFTVTIIGADNNAYSEYLKCKIREYGLNDHFQFTGFIMDMVPLLGENGRILSIAPGCRAATGIIDSKPFVWSRDFGMIHIPVSAPDYGMGVFLSDDGRTMTGFLSRDDRAHPVGYGQTWAKTGFIWHHKGKRHFMSRHGLIDVNWRGLSADGRVAFGKGMVLSVRPMGGDALIEVAFDTVGKKKLMLKAAGSHMRKL